VKALGEPEAPCFGTSDGLVLSKNVLCLLTYVGKYARRYCGTKFIAQGLKQSDELHNYSNCYLTTRLVFGLTNCGLAIHVVDKESSLCRLDDARCPAVSDDPGVYRPV
jgi:hypothetical protein